jgi:hypothetical protein
MSRVRLRRTRPTGLSGLVSRHFGAIFSSRPVSPLALGRSGT